MVLFASSSLELLASNWFHRRISIVTAPQFSSASYPTTTGIEVRYTVACQRFIACLEPITDHRSPIVSRKRVVRIHFFTAPCVGSVQVSLFCLIHWSCASVVIICLCTKYWHGVVYLYFPTQFYTLSRMIWQYVLCMLTKALQTRCTFPLWNRLRFVHVHGVRRKYMVGPFISSNYFLLAYLPHSTSMFFVLSWSSGLFPWLIAENATRCMKC